MRYAQAALAGALLCSCAVPLAAQSGAQLYEEACDAGDMPSCGVLGLMLERGEGVTQDLARAVSLQRRACEGGDTQICNHLGALYWQGELVAQSAGDARSAFDRACSGGHVAGCVNLGMMLREGHGAEPDFAGAMTLFQRACLLGHADGCAQLESTEPPVVSFAIPPRIQNRDEIVRELVRRYPPQLSATGIGSTVRVYFFVDTDGDVREARLATSSRIPALDEAALAVAEVFRFSPAIDPLGQPVGAWVSFPITFQVR